MPALVQTANPTATTGNTVATFAAPTTPGNLIIVFIGTTGANDTVGAPSDNARNTYTNLYFSGNFSNCSCYFVRNADSATTVTGTFVGTTDTHSLIVREYSGVNQATSILDGTGGIANGTATTAVSANSGSASKESNDLVLCGAVFSAASPSLTVGAGYGNFVSNNFGGTTAIFAVQDKAASGSGTQTGAMTGSPAGNWDCGVGCLEAAPTGVLGNTIKPLRSVGLSTGYASN